MKRGIIARKEGEPGNEATPNRVRLEDSFSSLCCDIVCGLLSCCL